MRPQPRGTGSVLLHPVAQINKRRLEPPSAYARVCGTWSPRRVKARLEIGAGAEGTMPSSRLCIGRVLWSLSLAVLLVASQRSRADADVADQAKQSQNPIADLISVPFQ